MNHAVDLPDVLVQMKTLAGNWDLEISPRIQNLTLYNKCSIHKPTFPNAVAKSIGVIFANTRSCDKIYPNDIYINKLENTKRLFSDVLEVTEVRICEDFSKDEIIEQFNELYQMSVQFENTNQDAKHLGIIVSWIGWHVDLRRVAMVPIDGLPKPFLHEAHEYKFERYGLTSQGHGFGVEEHCLCLTKQKSTHVFLFQDLLDTDGEESAELASNGDM